MRWLVLTVATIVSGTTIAVSQMISGTWKWPLLFIGILCALVAIIAAILMALAPKADDDASAFIKGDVVDTFVDKNEVRGAKYGILGNVVRSVVRRNRFILPRRSAPKSRL